MLRSVGLTIDTIIYDYKDIICTNPYDSLIDDNLNELIENCENFPRIWSGINFQNLMKNIIKTI